MTEEDREAMALTQWALYHASDLIESDIEARRGTEHEYSVLEEKALKMEALLLLEEGDALHEAAGGEGEC